MKERLKIPIRCDMIKKFLWTIKLVYRNFLRKRSALQRSVYIFAAHASISRILSIRSMRMSSNLSERLVAEVAYAALPLVEGTALHSGKDLAVSHFAMKRRLVSVRTSCACRQTHDRDYLLPTFPKNSWKQSVRTFLFGLRSCYLTRWNYGSTTRVPCVMPC